MRDPRRAQGYFRQDKKGKFQGLQGSRHGTINDARAFELIMQKKETLISFPDSKDARQDVYFH